MFNRYAAVLLFIGVLLLFTPAYAEEQAPPKVFLDGTVLEFEVQPLIVEGVTLVPLRRTFEKLGATVQWNDEMKAVKATYGETVLQYKIGDKAAYKNTELIQLPVPGQIVNGSTMMPLRFIAEALGAEVGWESYSRTILISSGFKRVGVVSKVMDGAAIEIKPLGEQYPTAETVRLAGVNVPVPVDSDDEQNLQLSKMAADYTQEQLEGKTVGIEVDASKTDTDGRVLGYVYLENGMMHNAKLIAEGLAQVEAVPLDVRWKEMLYLLQTNAQENERGMWM